MLAENYCLFINSASFILRIDKIYLVEFLSHINNMQKLLILLLPFTFNRAKKIFSLMRHFH